MNIKQIDFERQIKILPLIIIGSGVAGLTIGSKIKNNEFLILEARDRIGGRVFTNNLNIDSGAAWLHGSDFNPLNSYLNFKDLIPVSNSNPWMHSENTNIKYLFSKYNISEENRQKIALKWNQIAKILGNHNNKTIMEAFKEIKHDCLTDLTEEEYNVLLSFIYMVEVWSAGSVKNIPASFLNGEIFEKSLFGDYAGSHYLFKNGAETLIDSLLKNSHSNISDKIKFNQVVTKVIYTNGYVEVHTNTNEKYYCEKLCITIPPGPLKNIQFCPPLDNKKIESLSRVKSGSYKKVQLEFSPEDIFWSDNNCPMFLTSNPKLTGTQYYLQNLTETNNEIFPYILWNNYNYTKNKPILEAIFPADIGWKLSGLPDDKIIDIVLEQLNNYNPNIPKLKA